MSPMAARWALGWPSGSGSAVRWALGWPWGRGGPCGGPCDGRWRRRGPRSSSSSSRGDGGWGWGGARRWGVADPVAPVGTARRGRRLRRCPGTRRCVRRSHCWTDDRGPVSRAGSHRSADGSWDRDAATPRTAKPWPSPRGSAPLANRAATSTVARSKLRRARSASRRIRTGRALSTTTIDPTMSAATATENRSAVGRPWGRAPMWRRTRASAGRSGTSLFIVVNLRAAGCARHAIDLARANAGRTRW